MTGVFFSINMCSLSDDRINLLARGEYNREEFYAKAYGVLDSRRARPEMVEEFFFELVMYTYGDDEGVLTFLLKNGACNWSALLEASFARERPMVYQKTVKKEPNLPVIYHILNKKMAFVTPSSMECVMASFLEHITGKAHSNWEPVE